MAELQISDIPAGPTGSRRVQVTWQDGSARRAAVAEFGNPPDDGDSERIRWYLEEYAEFPEDPAPALAAAAEARLAEAGADLFNRVFSGPDAAGIWERARDKLDEVRVEVDVDPGNGPGLAWELLRDPRRDQAVALGAGAFVRTHLQAEGHPDLPEPSGDRLRVLLVIARPGGREDVPFRSVASRLVRGGAEQMQGLDLDVLRPATFRRLSEVLRAAKDAGQPYHVVHFDGHGTYVDLEDLGFTSGKSGGGGSAGVGLALPQNKFGVSVAGTVRAGQHGYLLFEDPASEENQQLVDGPTLGRLLTATGVPVLVLNACRSAYTEASDQSADIPGAGAGQGKAEVASGGARSNQATDSPLTDDVHARIRAYGSLAAEIADTGVPGVVAMRYNVYVVTAAQFMADLYAHLLVGKSLGEAAAVARKALAADPVRPIGAVPVALQDWAVPIVYEAAPLVLLRPSDGVAPLVKLDPTETAADQGGMAGGVPRPPDAGFFGRDETLLALDRAFDTQPIVLLHAYAGAGKSSTAAEFARWYQITGGLDLPDHPEWPGAMLWSSFEHHLTADRVIGAAGDYLAPLLEGGGIAWAAVTDPAQRRDLVLQVLAQVPVLWVWDNVEPVTGFPEGSHSDWSRAEQDDLVELLRDLAQRTRCRVLLTSRRDERHWLGDLPARVQLPPMPVRESLQLAAALAARHGGNVVGADWRPLLRYAGGNPLTVTVVVGQALREGITTSEGIEAYVARLRAGEADLEASQDMELGRSRSLAASLSYGFARAFTDAERVQLAVLHLFRDAVDVIALHLLGSEEVLQDNALPRLAGLDPDGALALLDRAADIGILEPLGGSYYRIHPALPWYFTALFTSTYGPSGSPGARTATRAYIEAIGALAGYHWAKAEEGRAAQVIPLLGVEEANLRHALGLARSAGLWDSEVRCLQGLFVLYSRTGRDGEWARLLEAVAPDFSDPETGGPLPGLEEEWSIITSYRMRVAYNARDWLTATALQNEMSAWARERAAAALAAPEDGLTEEDENRIRTLAVSLNQLGHLLWRQGDPDCLPRLEEALTLDHRIGDRAHEANDAGALGSAYLSVTGVRDLDKAEHWLQHSLNLREEHDELGRSSCFDSLGAVALERFDDAQSAEEPVQVLLGHLNAALQNYGEALNLTPADDYENRAVTENQLGNTYRRGGDVSQAMGHYQRSIQYKEARGDFAGAGESRYNIATLLASAGRVSDALHYGRAALANFEQTGPGVAGLANRARRLIADLEGRGR